MRSFDTDYWKGEIRYQINLFNLLPFMLQPIQQIFEPSRLLNIIFVICTFECLCTNKGMVLCCHSSHITSMHALNCAFTPKTCHSCSWRAEDLLRRTQFKLRMMCCMNMTSLHPTRHSWSLLNSWFDHYSCLWYYNNTLLWKHHVESRKLNFKCTRNRSLTRRQAIWEISSQAKEWGWVQRKKTDK